MASTGHENPARKTAGNEVNTSTWKADSHRRKKAKRKSSSRDPERSTDRNAEAHAGDHNGPDGMRCCSFLMHLDSHSSLPHVLTTAFIFPIPISAALVNW